MKRIYFLLLLSLLMTGSAFADCFFDIDDFTVTPEQLGTEIELCIKAEFSARLDAWQLDLTYPEGLTPVDAELGADGYIPYLNASGSSRIYTPTFIYNADYTRFMAATMDAGYWYDDNDDLTSYGMIKWEGGSYEEMVILHVQVSPDFQGGEIIMDTNCGSSADARGGTIRENGDYGVTFTRVCHVSSAPPEAYACYTPSNTRLTFYYDGMRGSRPGTTYDLNTGSSYTGWYSDGTYSSVTRVVFDSSFSDARPTTTAYWFYKMGNLTTITGLANLNTSEVTNMYCMFYGCSGLTSLDMSSFNTANVTNMSTMFSGCGGLTSLDLSNFNTSNVTLMAGMFYNCSGLTSLDLSNFNTAQVKYMQTMFYGCSSLTSLDLSSFNTANVTKMWEMFKGCLSLTSLDLSSFNTANVTDMLSMFYNCSGLTSLDLSNFNTANVTSMNQMFCACSSLTSLDLSSFNTANVTNLSTMFSNCSGLMSIDLSSFNTSNVTNMATMFFRCSNLKTIYVGDGWSTAAVTESTNMFTGCTSLRGGAGTTYDANHVNAAYAHIDGGTSNPGYLSAPPEAYACYTPSNTTLTFYYDNKRNTRPGTTYNLNTGYGNPEWYSDGTNSSVTLVVFDSSFSDARPTTANYWFINMSKLTTITGLANLNTSQVTIMSLMFYGCSSLTSLDLSNFNTANVTSLLGMFNGCRNLTYLDVSSFNTAKVNTMSSIFADCSKLTSLDLSNFITSNLTNMVAMFRGCSSLTSLDVSSFNSANVTDMSYMFDGCSSLTSLNVSSFNTSNVTDMRDMFYNCSSLTSLDLSSFNTANVTNMGGMFGNCGNLVTIYAGSGWSTDAVTYSNSMFSNCYKLVGGAGTTYHYTHTDAAYAHIDGGTSNPGYFTEKPAFIRGDVNGDGKVTITDVTALINYLLSHNATNVNLNAADCNESGIVNISDVTALINYLLSGNWAW